MGCGASSKRDFLREMAGEAESGDKQPGAVPPPTGGLTPPSHGVHIEFNFLEQLKHRNVGRVAILYVVVCYLILESFSVFIHVLGLLSVSFHSVNLSLH